MYRAIEYEIQEKGPGEVIVADRKHPETPVDHCRTREEADARIHEIQLDEARMSYIVSRYLLWATQAAQELGIPRQMVFDYISGWGDPTQ